MENHFTLNCETCGGALEYSADGKSAVCPYCGNEYNFTGCKSEALTLALNRANAFRLNCDFDAAITEYALIINSNPEDAEAYWGLTLSTYGIEYVSDARTGMRVPTCRRTVQRSILQDENYLNALKFSDEAQAEIYRKRAAAIDRLQRNIKRRMEDEESFDVFLCFRSADENGAPTRERLVARRIYDELSRRGIKTFFSEVTLKDRLGEDFEPVIFKALYSCRFFVLIAFSEENVNAPWVKNEWSRFRDREKEEHLSGACCAVFDSSSAPFLPAFLRSQQGINIQKYPAGGYETELADNLEARFSRRNMRRIVAPDSVGALVRLANIDLGDEQYESALTKFRQALEYCPDCAEAWWGCFLADRNAYSAGLAAQKIDYEGALSLKNDRNLRNAEKFGDEEIKRKTESFRKMCSFRCGELAAECDEKEKIAQTRMSELRKEREKQAAKRDLALKKWQENRKIAEGNYKKVKYIAAFLIVFWIFVGAIFCVTTEEDSAFIFFFILEFFTVFGALIANLTIRCKVKDARVAMPALEKEASSADAEVESLCARLSELEKVCSEERRRAETFREIARTFGTAEIQCMN